MTHAPRVAYFSMEIALEPEIPTYSGGLGVLAGDTIRSMADLGVPVVAVTLAHRKGYFAQRLDNAGTQTEEPLSWPLDQHLHLLEPEVSVELDGRTVAVRAWRYVVRGAGGAEVPVLLLDTDFDGNDPRARALTDSLYGGDEHYRLCQEAVLGIGGVRILAALGYGDADRFHWNEGHAALGALELLARGDDEPGSEFEFERRLEEVRPRCVFTTHTPVPAGHDRFPNAMAEAVLGKGPMTWVRALGQASGLNLTELGLRVSHFVNGVAMRHREVSQGMFPHYPIRSITNGIHPATWASPSVRELFDAHLPHWRRDADSLRYAVGIPLREIHRAHRASKTALIEHLRSTTGTRLESRTLTIGFARRATAYKRPDLVFRDVEHLAAIAQRAGRFQLVFAGKAHPKDEAGKDQIRRIFEASRRLRGRVRVAYLPEYDMALAKYLVAGCDVWLNTPHPPLEASGTSGMKAALNGVPSLSVVDGWWVEGCVDGVTGWSIGRDVKPRRDASRNLDAEHARSLYERLEHDVLPLFYTQREAFQQIRRNAIALNASFFNTQRMVLQYLYGAYRDQNGG